MRKKFTIIGWCNPAKHFMADVSNKFRQVMEMVENGEYFTINRPHQYGKTTMLWLLTERLSASRDWLVFSVSFEGLDNKIFSAAKIFSATFLEMLQLQMIEADKKDLADFLKEEVKKVESLPDLSRSITALAHRANRKMVLLIDEVDSSSNQELFLKFLGVLRHKYLRRDLKTERTFHSVILAGVHDVKTLKLKIEPENASAPYNSPWNIATDFEVAMDLKTKEIIPMLEEYSQIRGVRLDARQCAEKLVYYTSGYPFLVSALCKILDEKILPVKKELSWTEEDLDLAARRLITSKRSNTNFDHLIKNLENYPELYQLVFEILVDKQHYDFNIQNPIINLGALYGIFDYEYGNGLKIHNRIYAELIFNYMISKVKMQVNMAGYEIKDDYLLPENQLNLPKVLDRFQQFMFEQESERNRPFLEKNAKLLFLGFLQPILNSRGYAFKEAQISNEKRIDVVATYFQHKYIIELKIWRGQTAHEKGLQQLADYLDRQLLNEGYLLIFDFRSQKKSRERKWMKQDGKRIYGVWG